MNTLRFIIRRLPIIGALFVVSVVVFNSTLGVWNWWQAYLVDQIEQTAVFEYFDVEYVETTPDGIIMVSTAVWHRPVTDIEWADRLVCGGTWSNQTSGASEREPSSLVRAEWPYKADYPTDGRTCHMVSVISANYRNREFVQRVQSDPFDPRPEEHTDE